MIDLIKITAILLASAMVYVGVCWVLEKIRGPR